MHPITTRNLRIQDYQEIWQAMRDFTNSRTRDTVSELWVLQHNPVFTQGQAGKPEHLLNPGDIPVVQSDRGGQVTYHGPGQLIIYLLLDLHQLGLGVRGLVSIMEDAIIELLADYGIVAAARKDAPGVYVDNAKIASLGLRIRKGYSYHGLALNVDMDLQPFSRINPCGYADLKVTRMSDLDVQCNIEEVGSQLTTILCNRLNSEPS